MTILAEDVFLLLVDDVTGKPTVDSTKFPRVLAGALVLELAMHGAVRITAPNEPVKKGRLVVSGPPPQGPLLARAYSVVGAEKNPAKPQRAIEKLQRKLKEEIASRLVHQGYVTENRDKILGLFPITTWPARDVRRQEWARHAIESAIVDGTTPTPEISALISLISAIDAIPKVLPGVDKKTAKRRAKVIAEGEWASAAVRRAVQDVNTAVMAAVMVSVSDGSGSN